MDIIMNTLKDRDKLLVKEAKVKSIARPIGYNEIGEPIELVYDPRTNIYELHVGGEYVSDASQQIVVQFLPPVCTANAL